jgi:hypothetical protein
MLSGVILIRVIPDPFNETRRDRDGKKPAAGSEIFVERPRLSDIVYVIGSGSQLNTSVITLDVGWEKSRSMRGSNAPLPHDVFKSCAR